ncbi:aminotransferase class III-fold pyridoxal phosphate-dependent enzyme [Candidimonas sp. SYP-B2681]|uniref:aminotransferase family protein n=1 Tax=Candidimonas sp. SYP-B2681 TaxID=2497686 RepID=UPI000F870219|nr:aminotransferase class III-fold pyridoxal phosphate-dependent enzyme [Candidimonas sp. SYP-B2681]RTZ44415.1 aminotransferase class III-fold pyridoxal phosphate-dependent enzyme [Candidimonas sp. SYP-B2681]
MSTSTSAHSLPAHGGPVQVFYQKPGATPRPTVAQGKGIYLWDTDGKRYIDGSSGPIAVNIGHGNERVAHAARKQMEQVAYASRFFFENEANTQLSNLVTAHAGPGFERAFFVSGGSEATESALKLARQYAVLSGQSGRCKVISRNPSYHGATLGAVAISGDFVSERMYGSMTRPMPKVGAPFTYRIPGGQTPESFAIACAEELEHAIVQEGEETVLAFIMEPIGGLATGALVAPDVYYQRVREICSEHGVLLIYDEVMSGVGRAGKFLSAHYWSHHLPDIVTLAKGLASGYTPLGAVLASNKLVDVVASSGGFMHGFTYSSNPLSCAIGLAAVSETLQNNLPDNAAAMGERLRGRLQEIQTRRKVLGDVRGRGLLMAMEIVKDQESQETFPAHAQAIQRIVGLAMDRGLLLYSRRTAEGKYGEWVMVAPPLIIDAAQIDEMANIIDDTLAAFEAEVFA